MAQTCRIYCTGQLHRLRKVRRSVSTVNIREEMKRLPASLKTDIAMLPVFVALAVTGLCYHISGHEGMTKEVGIWRMLHVLFSLAFMALAIIHIKQHRVWYMNLFKPFRMRKTIAVFLTVALILEVLTGLLLLLGLQKSMDCGHLHWIVGVLLIPLCITHITMRWKPLKSIFK